MIHAKSDAWNARLPAGMSACPSPVTTSRVMAAMRHLGHELTLSPQVLRTLELLLSCLPPSRNHHMVFASNATLVLRSGGLSDRTLRRHIGALVEAGLVQRMDSPNKKRFTCYDPIEETTLRFGLDLSPLFTRFPDLENRAQHLREKAQQLTLLKRKLRAASYQLLCLESDHPIALEAMRLSRRNASYEEILASLEKLPKQCSSASDKAEAAQMSSNGGHNDCHHHSFNTEHIEKDGEASLEQLLTHCPEIQSYALQAILTKDQAIQHAKNIGPMIGIPQSLLHEAQAKVSDWTITTLIWLIVQCQNTIRHPAAYFRALTLGTRAENFRPAAWIRKAAAQSLDCPRTISHLHFVRGQLA